MGRRNEPQLTTDPNNHDDVATRQLLAAFGEPVPAQPPEGLDARVALYVHQTARSHNRLVWQRPVVLTGALALLVLLSLGAWGVLVNSLGPADVAGDPTAGLGGLILLLTLAAKPLVNLLTEAGLISLVVLLVAAAGAWLWWQIVRSTPLARQREPRS